MTLLKRCAPLIVCMALAACHGRGGGGTPNPTPSIPNLSGNYTGTATDSANGTGSVKGTFAQHGSAIGGPMTITYSTVAVNGSFALVVDSTGTLSGSMVQNLPAATCTFSVSGSYDTTSNQLAASYDAVSGCTDQSGTLTLQQQCFDPTTSLHRRKPLGRVSRASVPPC